MCPKRGSELALPSSTETEGQATSLALMITGACVEGIGIGHLFLCHVSTWQMSSRTSSYCLTPSGPTQPRQSCKQPPVSALLCCQARYWTCSLNTAAGEEQNQFSHIILKYVEFSLPSEGHLTPSSQCCLLNPYLSPKSSQTAVNIRSYSQAKY